MRATQMSCLLLLLLLLGVAVPLCSGEAVSELIEEEILHDTEGTVYFHGPGTDTFYMISNWRDLSVVPGQARFRYRIPESGDGFSAELSDYEHLPDPPRPVMRGSYVPPMFGKSNRVAFLRLSAPDNSSFCFSMEAAKRYVHMLSISIMLHTGNQANLDEGDCFISPECVPVSAECYAQGKNCLVNTISDEVAKKYGVAYTRAVASRIFFSHPACNAAPSYWAGLALVSDNNAWVNKKNYWTIVRTWSNAPEDLTNNNFGTLVHEVHHNMGFSHASLGDVTAMGFIKDFTYTNGYGDYSSFMGWGERWYNVPAPNTWVSNVARGNIMTQWFRDTEDGDHVYRLLAWDHPLTRIYLGTLNASFEESEVIQGIEFRRHAATLFFPFGKQYYSKMVRDFASATVALYYRSVGSGQQSYQERGVAVGLGIIKMVGGNLLVGGGSNMINAMNDNITNWGASLLPLGYVSMPELDTGTLSIEVMRFHQLRNQTANARLVESPPSKIELNDIPYVEIRIKQYPNVPFVPPTVKKTLDLEFSPSLSNCVFKAGSDSVMDCDRFSSYSVGWAYVKGGANSCREGNGNIPRLYNENGGLMGRSRGAINFYRGNAVWPFHIKCGRKSTEIVRSLKVNVITYGSGTGNVVDFSRCLIFNRPIASKNESDYKPYPPDTPAEKRWDAVVVRSFKMPADGGEVYVTDMYHNKKSMTLYGNRGIHLQEPYAVQAYSDNVVMVRNSTHVLGATFFFRYRTAPSHRLAVHDFDEASKTFELGSAEKVLNSVPTIMERTTFAASKWHYFVFTRVELRDYMYIDFSGEIPSNLILQLDTENGVFTKNLWYMRGLSDISLRLSFYDIHDQTGGWSEIHRFQFNKEVTLESIRVLTVDQYSQFPGNRIAGNFTETLGNETFRFSCLGSNKSFVFEPFEASFKGNALSFTYENDTFSVYDPTAKNSVTLHSFVLVTIVMILFFL